MQHASTPNAAAAAGAGYRVAYPGTAGAFSHEMAMRLFPEADHFSYACFDEVVEAVCRADVNRAVLPFENSLNGRVADTYRLLASHPVAIVAHDYLPIEHYLLAHADVPLDRIRCVRSHPQALGQCRDFLASHGMRAEEAANTALAAAELRDNPQPDAGVIASRAAAERFGLRIVASGIANHPENRTRFLVLAQRQDGNWRYAPGQRASLVLELANLTLDLPGVLASVSRAALVIVRLEAFPCGPDFLQRRFYLEVRGNRLGSHLLAMMRDLIRYHAGVRVLGIYADPLSATAAAGARPSGDSHEAPPPFA